MVNKIYLRISTEKYSDKTLYLNNRTCQESDSLITTPFEFSMMTDSSRRIFAIDSCCDALRFTSVPRQIPLKITKLHFPLIYESIVYTLWKYITIFTEHCVELWTSIQIIIQSTGQRMVTTDISSRYTQHDQFLPCSIFRAWTNFYSLLLLLLKKIGNARPGEGDDTLSVWRPQPHTTNL